MTWLECLLAGRPVVALAAVVGFAEPGPRVYEGPLAVVGGSVDTEEVAEPKVATPWAGKVSPAEPKDEAPVVPSRRYRLSEEQRARGMVGGGILVMLVGGLGGLALLTGGLTRSLWGGLCIACDQEEREESAEEVRSGQRLMVVGGVVLASSIISGIVLISVGARRLKRARVALTSAGLKF